MLRTALSLASVTGLSMRLFNIRAGRAHPGLQPQHIQSARAAAYITGGELKGDLPGSMYITYIPGRPRAGRYFFDVGTAGSAGLVFQTVAPALFFAPAPSGVTIKGGTHVPWSPPTDYLEEVFLPAISPMGLHARLNTAARGYYPAGGGSITASISPAKAPASLLQIIERGRLEKIKIISAVSNLPISIAERQIKGAISRLLEFSSLIEAASIEAPSPGRGTSVFILACYENLRAGFTALGARGKRAETVGAEAAEDFISYATGLGALDNHLSDQVLIYMALAGGRSFYSASQITGHLLTNIHVIEKFLPVKFHVEGNAGQVGLVRVDGAGFS